MASSIFRSPKLLNSKALFSTLITPFPSFRAAKSAILAESDPEKLAQIFDQCAQFPTFRRHRPIYHFSVHKLVRADRQDLIARVLEKQMNSPSSAPMLKSEGFWIRLMMLYSSAGMVDQAVQTLNHMLQSRKCNASQKSLCAILTVYLNNGLFEKVHELLETMPNKLGVEPSVVSHNLVLKAFVKDNRVDTACDWIQKMEKDGKVKPNIDSYNVLLGAYLKNGDGNGFDGLVKEVLKKGLEPNVTTYNHRISRMCKSKECARAKKLLDEMVSKGVKPNSASYNTIIYGFSRVGDIESAKKVLESMLADGYVVPCSFTYYTLIRSMVMEGEFDLALLMCKEIIRRKWVPPFEAMEGLVNGLVKMSRVEEAKDVVEKMKKRLRGEAIESWGKIEAALPL